jgi:hypothetical protein
MIGHIVTADPSLVRLVTRRFAELQGLRHAVVVVTVLALVWSQPYLKLLRYAGPGPAILGLLLSVLPCAVVLAARHWFNQHYRRRFGRVDVTETNLDALASLALFGVALWIDAARATARPSAVLVAGALTALHVVMRDWPWRTHHLFAAVSCSLAAWLTAAVPTFAISGSQDVLRIALTIVLLSSLVPAWLDHRLLVRTLGRPPGTNQETVRADAV